MVTVKRPRPGSWPENGSWCRGASHKPAGVEAVVIGTWPETAEATMRECANLRIGYEGMHRTFGTGSVSAAATEYSRRHGITFIDGGCPLLFNHRRSWARDDALGVRLHRQGPQAGLMPAPSTATLGSDRQRPARRWARRSGEPISPHSVPRGAGAAPSRLEGQP